MRPDDAEIVDHAGRHRGKPPPLEPALRHHEDGDDDRVDHERDQSGGSGR